MVLSHLQYPQYDSQKACRQFPLFRQVPARPVMVDLMRSRRWFYRRKDYGIGNIRNLPMRKERRNIHIVKHHLISQSNWRQSNFALNYCYIKLLTHNTLTAKLKLSEGGNFIREGGESTEIEQKQRGLLDFCNFCEGKGKSET